MNAFRTTAITAALAAAAVGLSACGSSTPAAAPTTTTPTSSAASSASGSASASGAAAAPMGTLTAVDQSSDGKSVVVASVDLQAGTQGGWIALHTDVGGKPGPVKYQVAVPAGMSANVMIPTPGGIPTGAYWPMLHIDDHVIGTYEFPQVSGADLPVTAGGMPVMKKITVTVK